jgi:hypothetical protein
MVKVVFALHVMFRAGPEILGAGAKPYTEAPLPSHI